MSVQPKRYKDLRVFLQWWYEKHSGATKKKPLDAVGLVHSFEKDQSPGRDGARALVEGTKFNNYLTAFRRLRQDARLRVARRFLEELP